MATSQTTELSLSQRFFLPPLRVRDEGDDRSFEGAPRANPGSARASRAISGASPEIAEGIRYAKRRLPHFERPWSKYAVAFSTFERRELSADARDIVMKSIVHGYNHGQYELYAACVMPDHVHILIEPQIRDQKEDGQSVFWSLGKILQGIKSSTAHRINKLEQRSGPVWEGEFFDRLIRSESDLHEKFLYISGNPWDAALVGPAEDYPWWRVSGMSLAEARETAREARALPGAQPASPNETEIV